MNELQARNSAGTARWPVGRPPIHLAAARVSSDQGSTSTGIIGSIPPDFRAARSCFSFSATEKGHLVRRKVYTKFPKGYQGQAVNMRNPLLVDVKVRKAMAHLYDRKTMLEKFAYTNTYR